MAETVSPAFGILYALGIFVGLYWYQYSRKGEGAWWAYVGFASILVVGELFINLGITKDVYGFDQFPMALWGTLLPWILVVGVLKLALNTFPGWLSPFANTFGYLFVSIATDMKATFDKILTPKYNLDPNAQVPEGSADIPKPSVANRKDIGMALEQIYTDKSVLLNELTLENIDSVWKSFKDSKLIRESAQLDDLVKLRNYILLKDVVAEYVWMVLGGILAVTISYSYILNATPKYTEEQQKIRKSVLQQKMEEKKRAKQADEANISEIRS